MDRDIFSQRICSYAFNRAAIFWQAGIREFSPILCMNTCFALQILG